VRIDAHHHLWDPARGDYPWMPADGPLHRPYLLADLETMRHSTQVQATIVVQAAPTRAESEYLLAQAARDPRIRGVIGWVELDRPRDLVEADLDALLRLGPLVGIRPMIEDIDDPGWLARPHVQQALGLLARRGLVFELLCREHQLPRAVDALARHENLRICVDHLAKPDYRTVSPRWLAGIRALAMLPHTYCKISGIVTELEPPVAPERVRAHVHAAAEAFGAGRLMYGSDWPVCRRVAEALEVRDFAAELTAAFTPQERARFWGQAASECYRLADPGAPDLAPGDSAAPHRAPQVARRLSRN
jgi:L-fuconolactonase